jgi:hypothetical protein
MSGIAKVPSERCVSLSAYSLVAYYGVSLGIDGCIHLAALILVWWPIMQRQLVRRTLDERDVYDIAI